MAKKQINRKKHDHGTDIIHKILTIHTMYPDWRIGQIIANGVREATGATNCDPFYIEDELLDAGLEAFIINSND